MHTRVEHPTVVQPADLDRYLGQGWYRIGQAMVTCRFVWASDGNLRDAVWTRTVLSRHTFSSNQRKLMRRIARHFSITEGPLRLTPEHEELYQRYKAIARGDRPFDLETALYGSPGGDRFGTRSLELTDERGRLVAFSAYDLGQTSLQSLIGVYDPDLAQHSLGFATLLLEVDLARQRRLQYHYSGYILHGDPSMDYKLRIGAMEFLHPDSLQWRPWEEFQEHILPSRRIQDALGRALDALADVGLRGRVAPYRYHEIGAWNPTLLRTLTHPLVVHAGSSRASPLDLLVAWDLDSRTYRVVHAARAEGLTPGEPPRRLELWLVQTEVNAGLDARDAAREVRSLVRRA